MRELKRLFIAVLALTFIAGVGTGAWVGTLTAGTGSGSTEDRRVEDFQAHFDLTKSQIRRLRATIATYDATVKGIRSETTREQFQRILKVQHESRTAIRDLLTDAQKAEYDKLLKGR